MKNLINHLGYLPRYFQVIFFGVLAIVLPVAVLAGWGPDRPIKDWNIEADRVGFDHVVFNSFINTPHYGDERTFFDGKDASNTTAGGFSDSVTLAQGDEALLRIYVHNNGNQELNDDPGQPTVARNARVSVELPSTVAANLQAKATISADNAEPPSVFDTVDFVSENGSPIQLSYVPGSALLNNNSSTTAIPLSDSIVTAAGAPIGFNAADGNLPGCFEFIGIVTLRVRLSTPQISLDKTVSNVTSGSAPAKTATAKPGETLNWQLSFANTGSQTLGSVTLSDTLPAHLNFVPGSLMLKVNNDTPVPLTDLDFFSSGVDIVPISGQFEPGDTAIITYRTTVTSTFTVCEATVTNRAVLDTDVTSPMESSASVTIRGDCAFACVGLTADKTEGNLPLTVIFNVNQQIGSQVQFQKYVYNFGDGSQVLETVQNPAGHSFNHPGTFTVTVQIVTNQGTTPVTSTCSVQITVKELPKPPVTVTSKLPDTGAGPLAGMLGSGSIGMAINAYVRTRRSLKETLLDA